MVVQLCWREVVAGGGTQRVGLEGTSGGCLSADEWKMLIDLLWFSYHPFAVKILEVVLIEEQVLHRLDVYS